MQPIPYFGERLKGQWIYEPKIDGWRMQVIRFRDGHIEFWGRRLENAPNWTVRLRSLIPVTEHCLPKGTLIDCELQSSKGRRFIPSLFARHPKAQPVIYVFDIIVFENKNISGLGLGQRKKTLASLSFRKPFVPLLGRALTSMEEHSAQEISKGHEGIIVKRVASRYIIGPQAPIATQHWRKIKGLGRSHGSR